jgi:hypothetical protein
MRLASPQFLPRAAFYRMEHQMRARVACLAGVSAAALVISGLSAGAATAGSPDAVAVAHSSTGVSGTPTSFPDARCGTAEGTWTGDGIAAQDGAPTNPALNTWGAKQVRCSGRLNVAQIVVDGYPNQAININFNIEVYRKTKQFNTVRYTNDPQPNDAKASICSYAGVLGTYAAAGVSGAQWTINLPSNCTAGRKVAKRGVWFSMQAVLDQAFGQWFWATQTTADVPNEADWRDTQNLFGLGCISFALPPAGPDVGANRNMQDCIFGGDIGEDDFIMVLN